jgi:hypothetical protein
VDAAVVEAAATALAWAVAAGLMADTLFFFEVNHPVCARRLTGIVLPGLPMERVVLEVLAAHLLALPQPPFRSVYYQTVLVDLTKGLPDLFHPAVRPMPAQPAACEA